MASVRQVHRSMDETKNINVPGPFVALVPNCLPPLHAPAAIAVRRRGRTGAGEGVGGALHVGTRWPRAVVRPRRICPLAASCAARPRTPPRRASPQTPLRGAEAWPPASPSCCCRGCRRPELVPRAPPPPSCLYRESRCRPEPGSLATDAAERAAPRLLTGRPAMNRIEAFRRRRRSGHSCPDPLVGRLGRRSARGAAGGCLASPLPRPPWTKQRAERSSRPAGSASQRARLRRGHRVTPLRLAGAESSRLSLLLRRHR